MLTDNTELYSSIMRIKHLLLAAMLLLTPVHHGWADERVVPNSRQEVSMSFAPLVKKVKPAVVNIFSKVVVTQRVSPFMGDPFLQQFLGRQFGGLDRKRVENALGSGVIVDPDGLVVTNAHVVRNAAEITVALSDGQEYPAKSILVDKPSDLALLRIDSHGQKLPMANLEPSENLEVGDLVLAIGNPFGVGQTVTSGIVSALARSSLNINDYNFFIQTDAAINPGNSGGPLINMKGNVIGINSAIYSRDGGSLGIGFAIPSEMVASLIAAEKAGQKGDKGVARAWLGMTGQAVTHDIAESLNLKTAAGVLVSELSNASPAKKAGLQVGDVVLAVNGHLVVDPNEMKFRMAMVPIGTSADFTILRKGAQQVIHVISEGPPDVPPREETVITGYNPLAGVKVANINPAVTVELGMTRLGINADGGVVVVGTEGTPSVVSRGDVIVSINKYPVKSVAELKKVLQNTRRGWDMVISRDGQKREILIR